MLERSLTLSKYPTSMSDYTEVTNVFLLLAKIHTQVVSIRTESLGNYFDTLFFELRSLEYEFIAIETKPFRMRDTGKRPISQIPRVRNEKTETKRLEKRKTKRRKKEKSKQQTKSGKEQRQITSGCITMKNVAPRGCGTNRILKMARLKGRKFNVQP